ncbi:MAG: Gfo/Idh/MocA family oxidoreductase [Albidovulum sp.]|nr:Gfo/Idh/MocA family oxidoreductase [Albidovulum sp.]
MDKVKLGIAGAGAIGKKHASTISKSCCAELLAIAGPDPDCGAVAAEYGVDSFEDTGAMLSKQALDGIIVSTPTELHLEPTLTALDAGVAVLVEKPIAATMSDAMAICERAESTGLPVLVGHQRRFYPHVVLARDIVERERIGSLVAVCGQWNARKHREYFEPEYRQRREASPIFTNLAHDLDTLRYICGEFESVAAETSNLVLGMEKDDAAAIVFKFRNGGVGTFLMSDQTPSPWTWEFAIGENVDYPRSFQNAYRFMGTEGSLEFPNLRLWRHDGEENWKHDIEPSDFDLEIPDPYEMQIVHFADVVRGIARPKVDARDGSKTLEAILAIMESSETGRRVAL